MFEQQEHDLTGRELRRVFLRGADMRGGAIFDSRLRGVDLWNIDIDGDLMNVRVNGVDIAPLVERMWRLRGNLTAYDAAYVAAAELLSCPLVTGDGRLAKASGVRCEVRVVSPP